MEERVTELQRMPTSGARAVEPFAAGGHELLAVPQLAVDVPGEAPSMRGGDSDTEVLLFERRDGRYEPFGALPASAAEDAEAFTIDGRAFLAVASLRTGAGPYSFATESIVWAWDDDRDGFVEFQRIESFAAKQFRYWTVAGRHFLGLAQGVAAPGTNGDNRPSLVLEWTGERFETVQEIASEWAYNWHPFQAGDEFFVAHAEHVGPSVLYRWDGERLVAHQELLARAGRAFATFERDGELLLLVAGLETPSRLMRLAGDRFTTVAELEGLGAREFAIAEHASRLFVVRVNFILGTPRDPQPSLTSLVYEFRDGELVPVAEFPTVGGTDVAIVDGDGDGALHFLVSNSLAPDLRFAAATVHYALELGR